MTVVLDSGVWISAFHFGGVPLAAVKQAFIRHRIAYCDHIVLEIETVLSKKFGWKVKDVRALLSDFLDVAERTEITGSLAGVCRDPKDDMIFECAIAASAEVIVSGDKDILCIENYKGIAVRTPREFIDTAR